MDPHELAELITRVEKLKAKQAELDSLQQLMANQIMSVKRAIESAQAQLRALRDDDERAIEFDR